MALPIFLTVIGLFFIFEASSVNAYRTFGDSFYFFKQQAIWMVIGIIAMLLIGRMDYHFFAKFAGAGLITTLVLLIAVLIPGIGRDTLGARRRIDLGFLQLQPTELAKLTMTVYLATWLQKKHPGKFLSFLLLLSSVIGLVMIQPDMGTTLLLIGIFIGLYTLSGEPFRNLLMIAPFGIAVLIGLIVTSSYRFQRLMTFMNPMFDPQGISYHVNQIFISLASGGIIGRGFSASRQKYQFLPEAHTDSIFAIIGEEFGFVGSVILIALYGALLVALYRTAQKAPDKLGHLLAGGVMILIALQMILNLGGMTALVPLTGVPLPFVSYGGASLVILYSLVGIAVSVGRKSR
jgi:cell division protein FtsW